MADGFKTLIMLDSTRVALFCRQLALECCCCCCCYYYSLRT